MTRMKKVFLAVVVLTLTCSLVIGISPSTAKATSKKETKLIKIFVHKDTGQILGVKLKKDDGTDQDAIMVSTTTPGALIGTILFHKQRHGCTVFVTGGDAWQVCYPSLEVPMNFRTR